MRRCLTVAALTAILFGLCRPTAADSNAELNWDAWRRLPVQNGGRHKPLDTLAWETLRTLSNRSSFADPERGRRLSPIAWYLAMLFDWQGWDHTERDRLLLTLDWRPEYFHFHEADKWDRAPLLRVDFPPLREALGLQAAGKYVSPEELQHATIEDRETERVIPFSAWGNRLLERKEAGETLTKFDEKGLELANHYWSYQNHRMGRTLEVLPIAGDDAQKWMPIAHLVITRFDDATDPGGKYRRAQQSFADARKAYLKGDATAFERSSDALLAALRDAAGKTAGYPSPRIMSLEVSYNQWAPFRIAWVLMVLAFVAMLLHLGSGWKSFRMGAFAAYGGALLAMLTGFSLRITISGRPPVSNMYESVIYVGLGVALFGLIFTIVYRRNSLLAAAAGVSTVALVLADNCPLVLDPSLRPLEPVLRSNFWLVTHVMTITLSYAAFALAMGIANVTLGYSFLRSENRSAISALSRFTYKALQVGVLLLASGTILGGVWADYSWGRFWGWDPKEVWALIALLGYLAVLHARFAGWVGQRGLAMLSVACFSLVIMAWYGVNFVLGAGLHSYGFGGGGQAFVFSAIALQLLFAGLAVARSEETADHSETSVEAMRSESMQPTTPTSAPHHA